VQNWNLFCTCAPSGAVSRSAACRRRANLLAATWWRATAWHARFLVASFMVLSHALSPPGRLAFCISTPVAASFLVLSRATHATAQLWHLPPTALNVRRNGWRRTLRCFSLPRKHRHMLPAPRTPAHARRACRLRPGAPYSTTHHTPHLPPARGKRALQTMACTPAGRTTRRWRTTRNEHRQLTFCL